MRATIIPLTRRNQDGRAWPMTPYRREMKHRHARRGYGQRWQAESAFSRHKRRLGPALRARTWLMQQWECLLRVLIRLPVDRSRIVRRRLSVGSEPKEPPADPDQGELV